MGEISKPESRIFWEIKNTGNTIIHKGFTDPDQVTTSGMPTLTQNADATTIYTPLPASGSLLKGQVYSYNKGMVLVEQDHTRTIYPPEQTPALFSVFRANIKDANWIENEKVIVGDTRIYNTKKYKVIQAHQTQVSWNPELTVGTLWSILPTTQEWGIGVAYKVNDIVTYKSNTYKCLQAHTSISTWYPSAVPALWKLQ